MNNEKFMNELLSDLREGMSVDDIADTLINNLNEANVKYQKEQEKAAAQAKTASACENIANNLNNYFKDKDCDIAITSKEVSDMLDRAVFLIKVITDNKIKTPDEVIGEWLKRFDR